MRLEQLLTGTPNGTEDGADVQQNQRDSHGLQACKLWQVDGGKSLRYQRCMQLG